MSRKPTLIIHNWGEHDLEKGKMAQRFREWGEMAIAGDSSLYGALSAGIADDVMLLELAAQRMPSQPPENMLFAAVHYLLLRDDSAELRHYYLNLTDEPRPVGEAFPHFRSFCLENYDAILALLQTRRTQTNAVRRCTFLLPAFMHVAQMLDGRPLAQLEFGCSGGLNLNWDHFGYTYGGQQAGNVDSPVQLPTRLRGEGQPPIGGTMPQVVSRVGLDLNPLDVTDADDADWLDALIWPELVERRALLRNAIAVARLHQFELREGDGLVLLPEMAAQVPADVPLVVYHSFVMYQLSAEMRQQFQTILSEIAATRESLFAIDAGWIATPTPEMWLDAWQNGAHTRTKLADMDAHGRWLRWLAD